MYCPNCGTKAVENAKFCMECGTKLTVPQTDKQKIELPSPLPKWLEGMPPRLQMANWIAEKYEKYQEALELAKEEMREHPSLDALSSIFGNYIALKQFDKAQQTLDELKKFGATKASLDLYQAIFLFFNERYKEAEPLLEHVMLYKKELPSKSEEILLLFELAMVRGFLEKDNSEVWDEIIKLKEYCSPSVLKTAYYMEGCDYFQKEQHNQAYISFVSAQKEGYKPDVDFCFLRAISGFSCGQLEYIQEDINFVLNSDDADEESKKIAKNLQEKLVKKETDIVVTDEVVKESFNKFYNELLETLEKYKTEQDARTAVTMFSSENLKLLMKHSIRYSLNYWETIFSPVMTSQLQTDFISAKNDIKHYVENFNKMTNQANFLIDDVIEHCPEDSLWEMGKSFLKGAITGYLGGGLGVLGLMFEQADENKTMNKTFNKWDTYLKQMMKEYDDVYSFIIEHMDKLIERHHIPIELSDENEDDD